MKSSYYLVLVLYNCICRTKRRPVRKGVLHPRVRLLDWVATILYSLLLLYSITHGYSNQKYGLLVVPRQQLSAIPHPPPHVPLCSSQQVSLTHVNKNTPGPGTLSSCVAARPRSTLLINRKMHLHCVLATTQDCQYSV